MKINRNLKNAARKTGESLKMALPIIIGVLMLVSLLNPLIEKYYPNLFTGNYLLDPLIGAIAGSFSFGIPLVSYVTGGELIKEGVSLLAVTAFMFAWSTVGLAMLPLEAAYLGKKFAILRNALNFISAILIAILVVVTLNFFHG